MCEMQDLYLLFLFPPNHKMQDKSVVVSVKASSSSLTTNSSLPPATLEIMNTPLLRSTLNKMYSLLHSASKTSISNKDSSSLKYTSNNSPTLSKTSILKLTYQETKPTFEKIIQKTKQKKTCSTAMESQKGQQSTTTRVNCCWSG